MTETAKEPLQIVEDGATTIEADSIVMTKSAARQVTARDARLDDSAVVVVEAKNASLTNSACVQVLAESVAVVSSPTLFVGAERATLTDSPVFLFLGRAEEGDVKTTLDWKGALVLGAAASIGMAVAGALLGRRGHGR